MKRATSTHPVCSRCGGRKAMAPGRKTCIGCRRKLALRRQTLKLEGRPLDGERPAKPAPPAKPNAGHMLDERGDREEGCAHYDKCLAAHIKAHTKPGCADAHASCPKDWPMPDGTMGCRWFEAAEPLRATSYISFSGAARGAA